MNIIPFKDIKEQEVKDLLEQLLHFISSFPLDDNIGRKDEVVLKYIKDYYNVLHYQSIKNPSLGCEITFTSEGKQEQINILDNSYFYISRLLNEIKESLSIQSINSLIELSNHMIEIKEVKLFHKIYIIDGEFFFLHEQIKCFIEKGDEKIIDDFLQLRIEFIVDVINNFENLIKGDNHLNQDIRGFYNLFNRYLNYIKQSISYRSDKSQAYLHLKKVLDSSENEAIRRTLIKVLIDLNSHYLLEPNYILSDLLEENKHLFSEVDLSFYRLKVKDGPTPQEMTIHNLSLRSQNFSEKEILGNKIITLIRFSIPYKTKAEKKGMIKLSDKVHVEYEELNNPLEDPIFIKHSDEIIGGIGFNLISDSFTTTEGKKFITILFVINDFYCPDKELRDGIYHNIDFSEERALFGREYYPHKKFVIEQLRMHYQLISKKINIKKEEINIDLFSNFDVRYGNVDKKLFFYGEMFYLTLVPYTLLNE